MSEVDSDEQLLMAKLRPADTGLPMVVWVSERGHARHASRIKVAMVHGPRIDPGNTASVSVQPVVRVVAGTLPAADLRAGADWIRLNEAVILDYWNSTISTVDW